MITNLKANKTQDLITHSLYIYKASCCLLDILNINDNNMKKILLLTSIFHDVGKIDVSFQDFLSKNKIIENDGVDIDDEKYSLNDYPRHNEISWSIFVNNFNFKLLNNEESKQTIAYLIYWHHAKILRKDNKFNNSQEILTQFENKNNIYTNTLNDYINKIKEYLTDDEKQIFDDSLSYSSNAIVIPNFKNIYSNLDTNNINKINNLYKEDTAEVTIERNRTLLRTIFITADRYISSLKEKIYDIDIDDLFEYIKRDINNLFDDEILSKNIKKSLTSFEDINNISNNIEGNNRNIEQNKVAKELLDKKNPVLFGPAGVGKTKIFLEWIYLKKQNKDNKQIYIIAPRNLICKGLYDELTNIYLNDTEIEIYTSEYKLKSSKINKDLIIHEKEKFESSIVITTIDQIISSMMSHKNIDLVYQILNSYLIFDEYHEYFNIEGIILMFKEIIALKQMISNNNILLVSATPNPFLLKYLNINENNIVKINTFNNEKYNFKIEELNNDDNQLKKINSLGSIIIYNTAKEAQEVSFNNLKNNIEKKIICYHSKFTANHKKSLMKKIMDNFGKNKQLNNYILRSGPIVQASLNISTFNMITQVTSAENWCQRLGRVNRFGDKNIISNYYTIKSNENKNKNKGNGFTLNKTNIYEQSISWIDYLDKNINNIDTLNDVYNLYLDFHKLETTINSYKQDFNKILINSINIFKNSKLEPVQFFKSKRKNKRKDNLSGVNIRGESIYVNAIHYEYNGTTKTEKYLFNVNDPENINKDDTYIFDKNDSNIRTLSSIQKSLNLKTIFAKSDFDINTNKKNYSEKKIIYNSKSKNTPIFLSYDKDIQKKFNLKINYYTYITYNNCLIGLVEEYDN